MLNTTTIAIAIADGGGVRHVTPGYAVAIIAANLATGTPVWVIDPQHRWWRITPEGALVVQGELFDPSPGLPTHIAAIVAAATHLVTERTFT